MWTRRFDDIRVAIRGRDGFSDSDILTIAGVFHLIGMVSSGKSTLMLLVAVRAAQGGQSTLLAC